MKRKRFFERSYFITLVLFLAFFNAGIFALAAYTHANSVDAAKQVCISEQFAIMEAFERDYSDGGETDGYFLMLSYGTHYEEKGILLRFANEKKTAYSNIPDTFPIPEKGEMIIQNTDGKKYIFISDTVCGGKYVLTYAKDISYLNEQLKSLAVVFGGVSVLASVILAFCLYFVQRKLYTPLKRLQDATNAVSRGDFTVQADETGNDEFASLAGDFNSMTNKINDQMSELKSVAEEKQRMLDNLGHEMRTPLTSIYGYAEHAFRNKLDEEKHLQTMLNIMDESKRLKRVGDILLEGAYLRENKIEKNVFSAVKLLDRIHGVFVMRAADKEVKITCRCEDVYLNGDKALIEILVSNLTENALRACKKGGDIELGAGIVDGAKTIYVKDNGIGMTSEQLSRITEPFYRTDKARSRAEGGTGLGLALCKTIADSHGAELYFESEPGKGTTAYLRFTKEGEDGK